MKEFAVIPAVTPVKTGAVSSLVDDTLGPGFRRGDEVMVQHPRRAVMKAWFSVAVPTVTRRQSRNSG